MRSLSARNQNFLRLQNPVSVCSWVGVSSDFDCLVTGHQDGSIGLTWLPTTAGDTPHSTILVHGYSRTITHIATASHHSCVACVESNGNLLLLRINGPRVPAEKLASLVSGAVEMVLGVTWSHSSTSLATLRYTHIGKTLSLRVYSGLNPENQPSTVTIILPKTMTGEGMAEGETQGQQRVAWGKDGGEDIIISLTNDTIIIVSTKSWQVVSQVKLLYSPRIFTASEGTIFALNNAKTLCFKKVSGQVNHFTHFSVDTCTWVSAIEMLVAAARDASRQMILFINKDGERVSLHPIATASPVLDIAWREGKNSIVCATEEGLYSLLFSLGVPSLKELAGLVLEDGSQLPRRIKYEVQLSQSSLLYPQHLLDTIELDVYSLCSNNKRKVLRVSKKYLGQDLDLFYLRQPKFLHKKNFKLHRPNNKHSYLTEILKRQLPESVFSPPIDTVVIPGKNSGTYFITRQNELLQITTKDGRLLIRIGSKIVRGEVRQEDGKSTLVIKGEESSQILGGRRPFGLVLLSKSKLALFDLLLLSLVYILHSY